MNTLRMLVRLAVPLLIFACSCEEECRPAVLSRVDEARSCVLPASDVAGLQFCHRAGAARTLGLSSICVSDAKGNKYVGWRGGDEHLSESGFELLNDCNLAPPIDGDGGCPP